MKKVIIVALGIVLNECLPDLLHLCSGVKPQSVPLNSCRNSFKAEVFTSSRKILTACQNHPRN